MNVAALRALHAASASEHAAQIVDAAEGLVTAANTVCRLIRDRDRAALDVLERISERAHGVARLANKTRSALLREMAPSEVPDASA